MSSEKSAVPIVLGAMTFGYPDTGVAHVRVTDSNKIKEMIDLFGSYNHTEIDTARVYGKGTSEKVLGDLKAGEKFSISSKQYPYTPEKMGSILNLGPEPWPLTRENIAKHVDIALKSTGVKKLKIFYLHGPDRATDIEETLKACDEQYKLGKFETLGISNFKSWEVAQACEISRAKGYVQPKVYQGNYSLVQRSVESELESCLRKYNMSFYAFSPLGGGFLTGSVKRDSQAEGMRRDSLPMPSATAEIVGDTDLIPPDYAFDLEKGQSENHEVNESEETSDKEEKDPFLIDSYEHDPSADPKSWNSYYRWFLTVIAGILVLNSTFSSSSPSGVSLNLMQEFTFSREVATLAISLFVGGYCIGPLLWGPLSEGPLGRKGVLLISFFCYWMFTLGCALSPNTASILIFRLLSGCFGAAPLVVSGAVIADLWDPKRRGVAMSVFGLAPFAGPAISPIISGFISASGTDWRILFWVLFAFAGACFVIILIVLPETYAPVLHQRIARRLRKETGDNRYRAPIDERKRDIKSELNNTILKPFIMLFLEPMLSSLTLFMSLIYGVLYLLFEAYPIVFGPGGHNFNEGIQGLMFLPLFIGGFCACLGNLFFFNPRYIKAMEKHAPKLPPPEIRLEQACVGGVAFAAAFFWFGWTSYPWISFWSPCIAGGLIGASILFVFLALFNYIIDAYLWSASTALAANTIVRSAFGAGFPLFASQMFETLNPRWASTLLGCIAALLSLIPFVLIKVGPTLRAKSKFAPDI